MLCGNDLSKCFLQIYLMDIQIWYTIISSFVGGFVGTQERLGEVISLFGMHQISVGIVHNDCNHVM